MRVRAQRRALALEAAVCYALRDQLTATPGDEIMETVGRHAAASRTGTLPDEAHRPMARASRIVLALFLLAFVMASLRPARAGPPYVTDDPEPTDHGHFEIFAFNSGTATRDGTSGETGIDFNYGATPDLQLTAVLPAGFNSPAAGGTTVAFGNAELGAKYRFLHQDKFGWDVAVSPRLFLPSSSRAVGERHVSIFLPIWVERDWDGWSTFGGGGCRINRGGGSQDFCLAGWALVRQVLPKLHLGIEIFHQTADTRGGRATTGLGAGARYDLSDNYHLLASIGPGIQNAAETNQYTWYAALLFTF
jgi:hypothetical protein